MKLLRRILALLIVTAYVGATMLPVAPTHAANADMSSSSMNGMMHEQDGQGDKMPCKGMLPNCVTDIGCIFLVTLPAPNRRSLHCDGVVVGDLRQRIRSVARAHDQARVSALPSPSPEPERADFCRRPPLSRSTIPFLTPLARVAPAPELTG